jgi:putative ABC transport system permease protein
MLGIIIGISSVIVLVGMGQGTEDKVSSQIESLGTNLLTVNIMAGRTGGITTSDLEDLKKKPGIKDIAPSVSEGNVTVRTETNSSNSTTTVEGCIPSSATIRNLSVQSGRFVTQDDVDNRYRVAVVGTDVASELYGDTDILGEEINIDGSIFTIVGVLASTGGSGSSSNDDKVIIPLTTAQRLFKISKVKSFYVEATSKDSVSTAKGYLTLFLSSRFKNTTNAYRIMDQTSLLETANETTSSLTAMLSGVASISLLVGGIGIMNIMLVSVIERTREIGLRKAIGAKRRTILLQFLLESAGISSVGGILGVLGGYLGAYIATTFFNTAVTITSNVVIGSFLFSIFVGVVFGVYPANKASKLRPIEALRFE